MYFTVNGQAWRLQFVRRGNKHLFRSDGSITIGVSDNILKTVFIADDLSEYMTYKVLCHELTHVHAMEYDYFMPIEVEEIVADFLSLYGKSIIYTADNIMNDLILNGVA